MEQYWPVVVTLGLKFSQTALKVILIFIVGYVAVRIVRIVLGRLAELLVRAREHDEESPGAVRKRVETLTSVLRTIAVGLIWAVVAVMSLDQMGLAIGPILAGAGIVGIAVGFGAQNLVRDVISGFFMILENQVRVGDVAIINGTGGLVEAVTFRTIVLRDLSAAVHVFPNGTITTLSNLTKGWSAYLMDIGVAYKEDTDRVVEVMRKVDEELRGDPRYNQFILEPIEVLGVDNFADSAVVIKARLKTQPIQQWAVGREYRRRLKKAFDAAGIEIPFPHRTLYMGEASKAFAIRSVVEAEEEAKTELLRES
jgi:moderate conductance mechanosensitive channel